MSKCNEYWVARHGLGPYQKFGLSRIFGTWYYVIGMTKYDTDLWNFLQKNNNTEFNLWSRIQLAEEFARHIRKMRPTGWAHRDLKPSNILMNLNQDGSWNGELCLTDFGIASHQFDYAVKRAGSFLIDATLLILTPLN